MQLGGKDLNSPNGRKNSNTKKKTNDGDTGGRAITLESHNFDIILNILIGIRRSLSDISEISIKQLDDYQFRKKLSSEIDWIYTTNTPAKKSVLKFKFIDYAPLVFYKLRNLHGISEESYIKSLGPN